MGTDKKDEKKQGGGIKFKMTALPCTITVTKHDDKQTKKSGEN